MLIFPLQTLSKNFSGIIFPEVVIYMSWNNRASKILKLQPTYMFFYTSKRGDLCYCLAFVFVDTARAMWDRWCKGRIRWHTLNGFRHQLPAENWPTNQLIQGHHLNTSEIITLSKHTCQQHCSLNLTHSTSILLIHHFLHISNYLNIFVGFLKTKMESNKRTKMLLPMKTWLSENKFDKYM